MKGILFTEFMELVEKAFGDEVLDEVIESSSLPNDGAYTAVGTYPSGELVRMITELSRITGMRPEELQRVYGKHLMQTLSAQYPQFFERVPTLFDFLGSVHEYIHVEVKKLYPDAVLPSVVVTERNERSMRIRYESSRKMGAVAHGLIEASSEKFATPITIDVQQKAEDGSVVEFNIKLA